jgi:ionotropic glutamate receptor
MSTAILKLSESGELQKIHDKWLSRQACSLEGAKEDVDCLSLKSLWGLFLLCGSTCFIALLCYLIKMIYQYMRHSSQGSQSFVSFVKEKENKVVEDTEKSDQIESEGR